MKLPKYIIEKVRKGQKHGRQSRKLLNEVYGFFEDKGVKPDETDVGNQGSNLGEVINDLIDFGEVSVEEFLKIVHEIVVYETIKEERK